jgi:hypothetical protein
VAEGIAELMAVVFIKCFWFLYILNLNYFFAFNVLVISICVGFCYCFKFPFLIYIFFFSFFTFQNAFKDAILVNSPMGRIIASVTDFATQSIRGAA